MEELENLHEIQRDILNKLLFRKQARFSELKDNEMESDQFNFHLKRLIEFELVKKNNRKWYELTTKGKEYANRFDTDKAKIEKQAKISILAIGERKINNKVQYLVRQRLKQPFYGFHGFVTGKVKWGESLMMGAKRELKEETGLEGKPVLVGVEHKSDYSKDGSLLEDKIFFVFKMQNTKGELQEEFDGGKNMWLEEGEIKKLEDLFDDMWEIIDMLKSKTITFSEVKYTVKKY